MSTVQEKTRTLRVLFDGTPLLGHRTGVGHYTAALAEELAGFPDLSIRAVAFTMRGWRSLRSAVPHGVRARGLPVPARVLRACWLRAPVPPTELFAGPADVVHATNFVLPPSINAGGVVTVHDLAFLDAPDELEAVERDLPEMVRRSARRAAVVCTPTHAVADVVKDHLGLSPDRIAVTPLGVNPAWFTAHPPTAQLREALHLPAEYLLFVGADGPRKGLPTLLDMHERMPDLPPLVLAGPGVPGTEGRVLRTGYLEDAVLRSVVAGAAALVLPSRDEGFGLPVLEALACGVPVVCTDVPALREVSGGLATHVPVGDPEALGEALRAAMLAPRDPATQSARRSRAAEFTWRRCAEATVAAYHRATL